MHFLNRCCGSFSALSKFFKSIPVNVTTGLSQRIKSNKTSHRHETVVFYNLLPLILHCLVCIKKQQPTTLFEKF